MEKSIKKKITKIIITLCSLFLVLVLAFSSYAWLATRKAIVSRVFNVVIDRNTDLGIHTIKIFKRFGADKAKDVSEDTEIVLTEFDTVFTDRNVNTSIIMRLELFDLPYANGKYQPFHLRIKCAGADLYVANMDGYVYDKEQEFEDKFLSEEGAVLPLSYWTKKGLMTELLSNIMAFRCGLGNSTLNAYTDPDEIYSNSKTMLKTTTQKTFVSTDNGSNKIGIITFEFSDYDELVYDGVAVVYIELDYSDKLIEIYSNQHDILTQTGEQTGGDQESIHFTSDLTNCFIFLQGTGND